MASALSLRIKNLIKNLIKNQDLGQDLIEILIEILNEVFFLIEILNEKNKIFSVRDAMVLQLQFTLLLHHGQKDPLSYAQDSRVNKVKYLHSIQYATAIGSGFNCRLIFDL